MNNLWYVYAPNGNHIATCIEIEAAACLMGLYGNGSTIRITTTHKNITVWTQGVDGDAMESYDHVAKIIDERLR